MTTGGCCHLPGSLCDCASSNDLWKSVEEAGGDGCQALYVTQVTAIDGRLLSSVLKPIGTQSDGPICRICHEGGNSEGLLSPCNCTGTLGTVHKSCLEKWLSSSNTSYCELCHTEFSIERRPRPLTEWLRDPGPRNEKRTLFCDMVCFLFITPLAAISGWLCLRGAQDHLQLGSWLQAVGLIALTIALFTIYVLWTLLTPTTVSPSSDAAATDSGLPSLASDSPTAPSAAASIQPPGGKNRRALRVKDPQRYGEIPPRSTQVDCTALAAATAPLLAAFEPGRCGSLCRRPRGWELLPPPVLPPYRDRCCESHAEVNL
ncbi:E3 ubiquitin-protein ligase MARCH2 [Collichthys lucidus]|uniref:E3 ubiquitin-protein ligase MARCHF2 n=1 Tax=Collichthys lucidus TaxID=240159 RepID=A0A4U5UIW9_COLLU|nr:E3 ubiquitin-protein ligase MARCH2 [Collichthys lucidus]